MASALSSWRSRPPHPEDVVNHPHSCFLRDVSSKSNRYFTYNTAEASRQCLPCSQGCDLPTRALLCPFCRHTSLLRTVVLFHYIWFLRKPSVLKLFLFQEDPLEGTLLKAEIKSGPTNYLLSGNWCPFSPWCGSSYTLWPSPPLEH